MSERKRPTAKQRRVVYYPPTDKSIEDYARAVCFELANRKSKEYLSTEVFQGFLGFVRVAIAIQVKHLNRQSEGVLKPIIVK